MVEIKQITNFDLTGTPFNRLINKNGEKVWYPYYTINESVLGSKVMKMGYCCEPKGFAYPIFLTINGREKEFQIGKTGMFEFQPEEWVDLNSDDESVREIVVYVTQVAVPEGVRFTLDYCYSI